MEVTSPTEAHGSPSLRNRQGYPPQLAVGLVAPLEYRLDLEVDYEAETFLGNLTIFGLGPRPEVELDCEDLAIRTLQQGGKALPFQLDTSRGKLAFAKARAVPAPVQIAYSGRAAKDLQTGLFVARLGEGKALTTMMEPEGCRRLLPCLDRPSEKAIFRLRVVTQPSLVVISNSEGESRLLPDGRREWVFAPTPPMSTYLLYLGVGPFHETESRASGTRIVVASTAEAAANTSRVLELAGAALQSYGEFYGVAYPLPKLHLVALTDFWAGMENWGAIAGDDGYFAFGPSTSPTSVRMAVETIAHEIAHQWFGDLVTLNDWDDLWLNESFAMFVTSKITDRAHLRDDAWGEFMIRTRRGGFADSLRAAHPVGPESMNPREIMARADDITYFKGGQLLRMIEGYLGPDGFQRGISAYLRKHAYGNARSEDLWRALEETSGRRVTSVMRAWVDRPGHPVVVVEEAAGALRLTQHRFTFLPRETEDPPWPIPLTFEIAGERRSMLFDSREVDMQVSRVSSLHLNPGHSGFYRTLYPPEHRAALFDRLVQAAPLDRWGLLNDAQAFLLSGDYSLDEYLRAVLAVRSVTDYMTVAEVAMGLDQLLPFLGDDGSFRETSQRFYRAQLERLGWSARPDEPDTSGVLREMVASGLAEVDDAVARDFARRFGRIDSEEPALRPTIAWAYARHGGAEALDHLLARAKSVSTDDAFHAVCALGGLPERGLLARALSEVFAPGIRLGDTMYLLIHISRNPEARDALWEWMTQNLREYERRAKGSFLLSVMLQFAIPSVGIAHPDEVREYFRREEFPEGRVGIAKGLELMEAFTRLRSRIPSLA